MSQLIPCPRGSHCLTGSKSHKKGSAALRKCQDTRTTLVSSDSISSFNPPSDFSTGGEKVFDAVDVVYDTCLKDIHPSVKKVSIIDEQTSHGIEINGDFLNSPSVVVYREEITTEKGIGDLGAMFNMENNIDPDVVTEHQGGTTEDFNKFVGTVLFDRTKDDVMKKSSDIEVLAERGFQWGEPEFYISYSMDKRTEESSLTVGDMVDHVQDSGETDTVLRVFSGDYPDSIRDKVLDEINSGGYQNYLEVKKDIRTRISDAEWDMLDEAEDDIEFIQVQDIDEETSLIYSAAKEMGCESEKEFSDFSSSVILVSRDEVKGYQDDSYNEDVNDFSRNFNQKHVDRGMFVYYHKTKVFDL